MDLDASSIESSEDWENSVNSSELDVQYQSDEERAENEVKIEALYEIASIVTTTVVLLYYYYYFYSIVLCYSLGTLFVVFLANYRPFEGSNDIAKVILCFLNMEDFLFYF